MLQYKCLSMQAPHSRCQLVLRMHTRYDNGSGVCMTSKARTIQGLRLTAFKSASRGEGSGGTSRACTSLKPLVQNWRSSSCPPSAPPYLYICKTAVHRACIVTVRSLDSDNRQSTPACMQRGPTKMAPFCS